MMVAIARARAKSPGTNDFMYTYPLRIYYIHMYTHTAVIFIGVNSLNCYQPYISYSVNFSHIIISYGVNSSRLYGANSSPTIVMMLTLFMDCYGVY